MCGLLFCTELCVGWWFSTICFWVGPFYSYVSFGCWCMVLFFVCNIQSVIIIQEENIPEPQAYFALHWWHFSLSDKKGANYLWWFSYVMLWIGLTVGPVTVGITDSLRKVWNVMFPCSYLQLCVSEVSRVTELNKVCQVALAMYEYDFTGFCFICDFIYKSLFIGALAMCFSINTSYFGPDDLWTSMDAVGTEILIRSLTLHGWLVPSY